MIIHNESPDQPEVRSMLTRLDAYCASLYPAESNHLMDIGSLLQGGAQGEHYGEIKRMVVDEAQRGRGTGRQLLEHIGMFAAMCGRRELKLETGLHQSEALALYERFGFVRCAPFGDHQPDPLSVFMEKRL